MSLLLKVRSLLGLTFAFIRRDFLFQWSYKFSFLYSIGAIVSSVITVYFVGSMFEGRPPKGVVAYSTDYFTFALVGMAFLDYMWVSLQSFSHQIRIAQLTGTLQAMLVTPTPPFWIIMLSSAYTYLWTTIRSLLYLLLGTLVFGASMPKANVPAAILFVALIILTFSGIGIASASLTLYLKQSDPLTSLIGGISFLFGGIVYPVSSLPEPLQKVSWALPMTHAVEGLRQSLLLGRDITSLWPHGAFLLAWAAILFPFSFWLLGRVMKALSREGSFGAY